MRAISLTFAALLLTWTGSGLAQTLRAEAVTRSPRLFAAASAADPAASAADPGAVDTSAAAGEPEPGSILDKYTGYWDKKFEELLSKPLWGNTASLPEGIFKIRYEFTNARADSYWDRDGEEISLLPPIEFTDFPQEGDRLVVDPRVSGTGGEHNFQLAYGITDPWDVFLEIPFTAVHTNLDLRVFKNGELVSDLELSILRNFIQRNGRPIDQMLEDGSGTAFDTPVSLGDIRLGTSYNFYRTEIFSAVLTPSVFFPTGNRANPDNDLTFLLGPEIDRGTGAWATNITTVVDIRPIKWLVFSFEVSASYTFGYDRDAPTWLPITDCRRLEDPGVRQQRGCSGASPAYDYGYDLENSATFPNLEGLDSSYWVEPTLSTGLVAGVTLDLSVIPIQIGYGFDRREAPSIQATGAGDSGPAFERLVDSLGLFEATEVHSIALGTSIPLFPLYIPMTLQPKGKWVVAGKNTINLKAQYSIAAELYLPINDFFGF